MILGKKKQNTTLVELSSNSKDSFDIYILKILLQDKTTKKYIRWNCDEYKKYGCDYTAEKEILPKLIINKNKKIIQPRINKIKIEQRNRTKKSAEVFTPSWVCNEMINNYDEQWFNKKNVFNIPKDHIWESTKEPIQFNKKTWTSYVNLRALEITCGEAPYLTSRYDTTTGIFLPIEDRIGILDRKLRIVNENTKNYDDWFKWVKRAYQSTYGYEYQGDSLLLARENLLFTFIDNFKFKYKKEPTTEQIKEIANIIVWNVWQMDGLNNTVPFSLDVNQSQQLDLFNNNLLQKTMPVFCKIKDWRLNKVYIFDNLKKEDCMKFDIVIGNPPYQGDNNNLQLYPSFYLSCQDITKDCFELIFPSAWQEPKNANGLNKLNTEKVKKDKQIVFIENKVDVFKGITGVKYTNIVMWKKDFDNGLDGKQRLYQESWGGDYCIINLPINKEELEKPKKILSIIEKINILKEEKISSIGSASKPYGFRADPIDDPSKYNIILLNEKTDTSVRLFGKIKGKRDFVYIEKDGLPKISPLLDTYKLFVPKAWGNMDEQKGFLGGSYSEIIVAEPKDCCSETYIEFGPFENKKIADNAKKYFYTKFFRAVFYKNKFSQNTARDTYISVPIQDFTENSNIDWNKNISEIDQQLYKKYNLNQEEIDFIEAKIKPME